MRVKLPPDALGCTSPSGMHCAALCDQATADRVSINVDGAASKQCEPLDVDNPLSGRLLRPTSCSVIKQQGPGPLGCAAPNKISPPIAKTPRSHCCGLPCPCHVTPLRRTRCAPLPRPMAAARTSSRIVAESHFISQIAVIMLSSLLHFNKILGRAVGGCFRRAVSSSSLPSAHAGQAATA